MTTGISLAIHLCKCHKTTGNYKAPGIVLDMTIPGGAEGKETLLKFRDINPEVKAILSSSYSNDSIMTHYAQYGFSGILIKPYTLEELDELLSTI